jgi:hypothetical protein
LDRAELWASILTFWKKMPPRRKLFVSSLLDAAVESHRAGQISPKEQVKNNFGILPTTTIAKNSENMTVNTANVQSISVQARDNNWRATAADCAKRPLNNSSEKLINLG